MKVIKDFLPQDKFYEIKSTLEGLDFPWYYSSKVAKLDEKNDGDFYFFHNFFQDGQPRSHFFNQILMPILGKLQFEELLRCRSNGYTRKSKQKAHDFHIDSKEPHTVVLYSVNTNNGYTLFKDGTKQQSIENTALIFDGNLEHASVPQTDEKFRININLNIR